MLPDWWSASPRINTLTLPQITRQSTFMPKLISIFMRYIWFSLGLILFTSPVHARTIETQLDNGLKIIVHEDRRAPVVVSQLWYRIGSTYEHSGKSGLSHVLEHMMFKGTESLKPGEFSEIIAANGGSENAFTSRDFTAYVQRIASDRLELCLKLEADRMRNVVFRQSEFAKEVAVVREERRWRVDSNPKSKLFEQFYATAYLTSPMRIPTIGWMDDLKAMQMEDAESWYRQWYAPNNATLVIVGDVDSADAIALASKYFADLKSSRLEEAVTRPEIEQSGMRRIEMHGQTANPYVIMGYKVPILHDEDVAEDDVYALSVLTGILDGGSSARIPMQMLRGDEVAVDAGVSYDPLERLAGLFMFAGTPNQGVSTLELEQAFKDQITELRETPVSMGELDRVKAQVIANKVFEKDSMFSRAMQIGMLDSVGHDWRLLDQYVEKVGRITPEDIQRVAKAYFDERQLTVATLIPQQDGDEP